MAEQKIIRLWVLKPQEETTKRRTYQNMMMAHAEEIKEGEESKAAKLQWRTSMYMLLKREQIVFLISSIISYT